MVERVGIEPTSPSFTLDLCQDRHHFRPTLYIKDKRQNPDMYRRSTRSLTGRLILNAEAASCLENNREAEPFFNYNIGTFTLGATIELLLHSKGRNPLKSKVLYT